MKCKLSYFLFFLFFFVSPLQFLFAHSIEYSSSQVWLKQNHLTHKLTLHSDNYIKKFQAASIDQVQSFFKERIQWMSDGQACQIEEFNLTQDSMKEETYLQSNWNCPSETNISLQFRFFIIAEGEVHFLKIYTEDQVLDYTLNAEKNELKINTITSSQVMLRFLHLGFTHILEGFDHVLFVFTLLFASLRFKRLILYASIFTLSHSLSLAFSVYGYANLNPQIVEPLIALSIIFSALKSGLYNEEKKNTFTFLLTLSILFSFGLLHGLGFAGILNELNIENSHKAFALLFFNIGVEMGQALILILAFPFLKLLYQKSEKYFLYFKKGSLILIALASLYWFIERLNL